MVIKNTTNRSRPTIWLTLAGILLAATLATCSPPPPKPTPTPTRLIVEPGDTLRVTLEPVTKPTQENPQVVLHLTITDAQTGASVQAAFVSVDHKVVAINVHQTTIILPGRLLEPTNIQIATPGYETWSTDVRWKLDRSRRLNIPIELTPLEDSDG